MIDRMMRTAVALWDFADEAREFGWVVVTTIRARCSR